MELILIALLAAVAKFVILVRIFGIGTVMYFEKPLDVLFTVVVPLLFLGTFSGAVLAALSGLAFSLILHLTSRVYAPIEPRWISRVRGLWRWKRGVSSTALELEVV